MAKAAKEECKKIMKSNEDCKKTVEEFKKYLMRNSVKDLVCNTTKILLICESPHTDELDNKRPLVGSAGKSALNYLISGETNGVGLGDYLASQEHPTIGIMNVCQAPLQKTDSDQQTCFDFSKTKSIRNGHKHLCNHMDTTIIEMEKIILVDFKKRLKKYAENKCLEIIIPCGRFAESYFNSVNDELKLKQEFSVSLPHPARNGWANPKDNQKDLLEKLKREIRRKTT